MGLALSAQARKNSPKDSATLILVRFDGPGPRILMGRRHNSHAFMPGKFVFPGGRLEPSDSLKSAGTPPEAATIQKLQLRMRNRPSASRAAGLLVAAIRETYEETGLLVGRDQPDASPDLSCLIYFARAITPPGRSRRFDSRFLVADAAHVSNLDNPHAPDAAELLELNWVTLAEAMALDLPSITRDVLLLLQPHLEQNILPPMDCPVSFHHWRGKAWMVETLALAKT
jgi:8-oxo-dGTP pyrophosphatase MutT (NUDIX family)